MGKKLFPTQNDADKAIREAKYLDTVDTLALYAKRSFSGIMDSNTKTVEWIVMNEPCQRQMIENAVHDAIRAAYLIVGKPVISDSKLYRDVQSKVVEHATSNGFAL